MKLSKESWRFLIQKDGKTLQSVRLQHPNKTKIKITEAVVIILFSILIVFLGYLIIDFYWQQTEQVWVLHYSLWLDIHFCFPGNTRNYVSFDSYTIEIHYWIVEHLLLDYFCNPLNTILHLGLCLCVNEYGRIKKRDLHFQTGDKIIPWEKERLWNEMLL